MFLCRTELLCPHPESKILKFFGLSSCSGSEQSCLGFSTEKYGRNLHFKQDFSCKLQQDLICCNHSYQTVFISMPGMSHWQALWGILFVPLRCFYCLECVTSQPKSLVIVKFSALVTWFCPVETWNSFRSVWLDWFYKQFRSILEIHRFP